MVSEPNAILIPITFCRGSWIFTKALFPQNCFCLSTSDLESVYKEGEKCADLQKIATRVDGKCAESSVQFTTGVVSFYVSNHDSDAVRMKE